MVAHKEVKGQNEQDSPYQSMVHIMLLLFWKHKAYGSRPEGKCWQHRKRSYHTTVNSSFVAASVVLVTLFVTDVAGLMTDLKE